MKLYLKSPVYFEIEVPNGTDRSRVTSCFHETLEKNFKRLIRNIRLEKKDLEALHELAGITNVRLLTEMEVAINSGDRSKIPDFLEY